MIFRPVVAVLGSLCLVSACGSNDREPADAGRADAGPNLAKDHENCGSVGHACGTLEHCVSGACVDRCEPFDTQCGAHCFDLRTDRAHCGSCSQACAPTESCTEGVCGCTPNERKCGATCVAMDDHDHCGRCANACAAGEACNAGTCTTTCNAGSTLCVVAGRPTTCADLQGERANCGSCGHVCGDQEVCESGECMPPLDCRW